MKIAFFTYPAGFQAPGGVVVLLTKTKEALERKGIKVKLFNQWEDRLKDFDILHVFGSNKENLGLIQTARTLGVKVVVSPIFWSTFQRAIYEYGSLCSRSQMVLRHMAKVVCPIIPSARRDIFLLADAILPNSHAEADQVARLFYIDKKKMHIVYLAADERFTKADETEFVSKYAIRDFVLSIGRIEPRKNQLNLIRALKNSGLPLVFIGDAVADYKEYYEACRRNSDKNTLFISRIDHNDTLLASAYAACGVFVLQGWFETPGLVALEAGLAGARLAVTIAGSTKEYFKDYVEYFNPADPREIRIAVEKVSRRKREEGLKKYILNHFLWHHSAEENIKAYRRILR